LPEHLDEALGVLRTLSKTESLDIHLCPLSWVEQFPKLWVFDVDSTLIFQETIDELAALSDQKETVSKITQEAMEGKLPFDQALVARLKLIEGTPVEALQQVDESLKIRPEMEQLVNWVRNWGCQVAFVSGGFTFFVSRLANKLRVPHYHANELVLQKGKVTGEVSPPIVTGAEKAKFVDRLISKLNLKKKDVAVIGDGANDRHMMSKAAVTVGYNPKPALEPHVALVVRHSHILSILGIWQRSLVSG
jgi:phosphoserine phosphatase